MPLHGDFGQLREVRRIGADEELSLEWRIPDFLSLYPRRDGYYRSTAFSFSDARWYLFLFPNWTDGGQASGWLRLNLCRFDAGSPRAFHVSVGFRGSGGVEKVREGEKEVSRYGFYDWRDFCSRSELVQNVSRLMPDGAFTVTCVLKRRGALAAVQSLPHPSAQASPTDRGQSSDKQDVSTQTDNHLESEVKKSAEKRGCEKVCEDLAKLLTGEEYGDVTVQVGDVEFKVHKDILSVRSPVLAAMFRHETEEKATNRISIGDCEPDVFKLYLHFLYTGSVELLSEQSVFDLYHVADKYLADELKQKCLEHIQAVLSVQTFCDTVKLALAYSQSDLLAQAINFATQNLPSIIRSVEWQNLIREFPTEANEILIKCIKP